MKRARASVRFKVIISLCALLLCVVVVLAYFLAEPKPVPFLVLQQPFSKRLPLRDQLVQWIPTASSWLPKVEDALLGPRKPVKVFAHIIALPMSPDENLPYLSTIGRPAFLATNGLQVWLLSGAKVAALRNKLKGAFGVDYINQPRISTADGAEASLFVGESISLNGSTNEVGLRTAFFPRVHEDFTDLIAVVSFSELVTNQSGILTGGKATSPVWIRTNLDVAARLQVPKGSGLFLLNGRTANVDSKRFGVLIEPP